MLDFLYRIENGFKINKKIKQLKTNKNIKIKKIKSKKSKTK